MTTSVRLALVLAAFAATLAWGRVPRDDGGSGPPIGPDGEPLSAALGYADLSSLRGPPELSAARARNWLRRAARDRRYQAHVRAHPTNIDPASTIEAATAYANFYNNVRAMRMHERDLRRGKVTHTLATNQFSTKSPLEFAKQALKGVRFDDTARALGRPDGARPDRLSTDGRVTATTPTRVRQPIRATSRLRRHKRAPASVDWRDESGVVSAVRDQGECGSCYAMTAAAAIESARALAASSTTSVSTQQILDCSADYGTDGCDGGWIEHAFELATDAPIATEDEQPYQEAEATCVFGDAGTQIAGHEALAEADEDALMAAVAEQPVAVAMHMDDSLQHYSGGVYAVDDCPTRCDSDRCYLNHALLLVGYGEDSDGAYWIAKNSWGTSWGENGYLRIKRGVNMCGIATKPFVPLV